MSGRVTLRPCRLNDLGRVVAIERASFPDPYPRSLFAALLLSPLSRFVVACVDDVVVGYVLALHEPTRDGQIMSIAVSCGHRGKGVGRALMAAAMESLGRRRVHLLVRRSNQAAIRLYRSFLFKETGLVVEGYYPDGEDALEFERVEPIG
jgi:[ribosomal protein S18]-alanine N-acetyltransferase